MLRGCRVFSTHQKCTAAIRQLAYRITGDTIDDYVRMGESTSSQCLNHFVLGIIQMYGKVYLRKLTYEDIQQLYVAHEDRHGFPGMLGSLDCMHWEWANCPVAWQGQYHRGDKPHPSIILEAAASQDAWIWHAFFGCPGAMNDLNVLNHSPIFEDVYNEIAPDRTFQVNGATYKHGYYLGDGIYPEWATFVKAFSYPEDDKRIKFKGAQEAARKDIERAFGILQKSWSIIKQPARIMEIPTMSNIMYACIILHNMILENKNKAICVVPNDLPDPPNPQLTEEQRMVKIFQSIGSSNPELGFPFSESEFFFSDSEFVLSEFDIERAFGILQKRWSIIKQPARIMEIPTMSNIMYACIILHNMILETKNKAICVVPNDLPDPPNPQLTEEQRMVKIFQSIGSSNPELGFPFSESEFFFSDSEFVLSEFDIERAFGILQKRWSIIKQPARIMEIPTMSNIMYACIILHNMILENKNKAICVVPNDLPDPPNPQLTEEQRMVKIFQSIRLLKSRVGIPFFRIGVLLFRFGVRPFRIRISEFESLFRIGFRFTESNLSRITFPNQISESDFRIGNSNSFSESRFLCTFSESAFELENRLISESEPAFRVETLPLFHYVFRT
ncbi:hypothetical protein OSB04_030104 [Centaurea solstitialis]|uniref:Uncharacterized protein n=1 Tax=Centaurea solstitialis TaxID=347529 RepID=A0AA38SJ73_9ASTR|nr:hypothetical protein OSB04_030104 [Centaurea solstitialis]